MIFLVLGLTNSAHAAPADVNKSFLPTSVKQGSPSTLTITLFNPNFTALSGANLTDTFPVGMKVAAVPNTSTTCSLGVITAVPGAGSVSIAGGTIPATVGSTIGRCTIKVDVSSATVGNLINTIAANALVTGQGESNPNPASATLQVTALSAVGVTQSFTPNSIPGGGTSTLTIQLSNLNANPLTGVLLNNNLPTGVTIANPASAVLTGCGPGVVNAVVAGTSFSLNGGTIAANSSCSISVNVTSITNGTYTNSIPVGAVITNEGASNAAISSTTLQVQTIPQLSKAFSPSTITAGGVSQLSITITNGNPVALTNASLVDTYPAGLVTATPLTTATTCPGGTVATTSGNLTLTGATIPSATGNTVGSCTVTVNVTSTVAGTLTNSIPANALTNTQGITNLSSASATLTIPTAVSIGKKFSPTTFSVGGVSLLTITLTNNLFTVLNVTSLTDNLPAGTMAVANPPSGSTTCSGGSVSATAGGSAVTLSGGVIPAQVGATPGTCVVTVNVTALATGTLTNTIPANALTTNEGIRNSQSATANATVNSGVKVSKAFSPTSVGPNTPSTLTITVTNTSAAPITGVALTDNLPTGTQLLKVAPTPAASTTCSGGAVTAAAGSGVVMLTGATIPAAGVCTILVNVVAPATGSKPNTIPANAVTTNEGLSNSAAASATLTVNSGATLSKSFSPSTVAQGGTSTLTITVSNYTATSLTGATLTDSLPTGVQVATVPNSSTTCLGGTVTAVPASGSIALSGGTIPPAVGATPGSCTFQAKVTSTTTGVKTNTIPVSALTTNEGISNTAVASSTLTVTPGATLSKSFSPSTIAQRDTSILTITVSNATATSLTGATLTDNLPTGVQVATVPNSSTTCLGGTVTAVPASGSVALSGGTIPPAVGATPGSCTFQAKVTSATTGVKTNTIPIGALTTNEGVSNTAVASSTLTVTPGATLSKSFSPSTVGPGGTPTLTITVFNATAAPLTGATLTDNLPTGVQVATAPNSSTTCLGGTVTAVPASGSIALSGGTIPPAVGATPGSCTFQAKVTSATTGVKTNTIPIGALTTNEGVSNSTAVSAALTVTPLTAVTVNKAFAPNFIGGGSVSQLQITVTNPGSALDNLGLVDTFPVGMIIAATPAASTTCSGGTLTATPSTNSILLSGGSIAGASATCQVLVNVTSVINGNLTNTIGANSVTSDQGITNTVSASATLTTLPGVGIGKSFTPSSIAAGDISVLKINVYSSFLTALTNAALTDNLPAGVTIANPADAVLTGCGSGTINATAGSTSIGLVNATIPASGSCSIAINVTSSTLGAFTNTIPANALTNDQGASNPFSAQAVLTVRSKPTITKAFSPSSIPSNGTSVLTFTITNPNTSPLTNAAFTDTYPSGLVNAPASNPNTNSGGTVTALPADNKVSFTGGTIPASGSRTVSVTVTAATPGDYLNSLPANGLTTAENVSNAAPANATLRVLLPPTITKVFTPGSIGIGGVSVIKVTITNPNATAITAAAFTDNYPANLTNTATPAAAISGTGCTGTVTAASNGTSLGLSGGTIPSNSSCDITVNVISTSPTATIHTNPSFTVSSTNAGSGTATTANLTVNPPLDLLPNLRLVKRITAINANVINTIIDPTTTPDPSDNAPNWPVGYLKGAIDGGLVKPGDELEYTIYFLSDGDSSVKQVLLCDLIPANSAFSLSTFNGLMPTDGGLPGADSGIALAIGSTTTYLSNVLDTDRGQFFTPSSVLPASCNSSINPDGAVLVNVVTDTTTPSNLPNATAPGTPTGSYGFIRFRAKVN